MPTLRIGSQNPEVKQLQQTLNSSLKLTPPLRVDGIFGPRTDAAVRRFQDQNWLQVDGIVGPCTQSALYGKDRYVILKSVNLIPQPTPTTCWAASTGMLLGRSAPVTLAPPGVNTVNGLPNDSDLDSPVTTSAFASFYGLRMLPGQSWTPDGLAGVMRGHAPIMVDTLWDTAGYTTRQGSGWVGSSGHMRIFAGIRGDGTADGTTIRVYDPWPPGKGAIYSVSYGSMIAQVPTTTYQIYYR